MFPEHDVTELRQTLATQSYSNLYRALDDLLLYERQLEKDKGNQITLRTRIGLDRGSIETRQRFRSEEYQTAVYKRLRLEFAQHDSPSTIRAVLGENNHDYERTRDALAGLFTKRSLWSMVKGLFSSKAKEAAEKQLRANPSTGCEELDLEIAAIQAAVKSGLPREPWPFLEIGHRVRIEQGPLCGVEGILLGFRGHQRLVLSITLLQRSVAVQVDEAGGQPIPLQHRASSALLTSQGVSTQFRSAVLAPLSR